MLVEQKLDSLVFLKSGMIDKLSKAIAESGMSENEWLEQTIIEKLKA